ncbi:MAG: helix-turn-helix domain-containing protein [archaeon]
MIIKPDLVKKIKTHFDLNIYETKVWLALISKGIASAGEVAEISGVPRSRTYDVLESLEKQGFVIAKIGKPVKYIAVKPTLVVEKLKNNTLKNAEEKIKILGSLKETKEYEELEELHKTGIQPVNQSEMSSSIRGKSNIYSHVKEMLENSEKEVIICIPASEVIEKSRIFNVIFDRLKKSDIKLKLAVTGSESESKEIEKKYKIKPQKINIDARFFISDRNQVLFMLNQSNLDDQEIGIWLNSEIFSGMLASMFELAVKK